MRLGVWLLAIVGALIAATDVVGLLQGLPARELAPVALVAMASALPLALPVMVAVSMAAGAAELARRGILITRRSAIEDAADLNIVCTPEIHDPDAHRRVAQLHHLGVEVVTLAGDALPVEKLRVVARLQQTGHVVGMTGDGVDDAPALRRAEVGIAVRGATDLANGAASVVLRTESLPGIVDLVTQSRATYQRVLTWIVDKIGRTVSNAGFVAVAFLITGHLVISPLVMLLLVCVIDVVRVALATDRVHPAARPETWDLGPLSRIAAIVGVMTLTELLALLALCWHRFGLAGDAGRLQTFTLQSFLFFSTTSLLSLRERRAFWRSRPSAVVVVSLAAATTLGFIIAPHGITESALLFGYAAICTLGPNDLVKSALCRHALPGRRGASV